MVLLRAFLLAETKWAVRLTFAGVGLRTNFRDMSKQGLRPLVVGALGGNLDCVPYSRLAANRIWGLWRSHFEIEVIMVSTPRIEVLTARRAPKFALHVLAGWLALCRRLRKVSTAGSIRSLAKPRS
jgi:hypothetical protein